jgi:fatty acid desaturase
MTPPLLADIAPDLTVTTVRQRWVALARPYLGIAVFALVAWPGWWWLTPLVMFGIFVAVVTVTHDVVHRSIGLSRRQSEWALFLLGLVLLESGHAYRLTHLQHHRLFPSPEDPEGYPAELSFVGAVLYGPVFLVRLWWWAYQRSRGIPAVFLELTYHLEHHLYPQVPSHRLAELARRLDPFLAAAGVRPNRII